MCEIGSALESTKRNSMKRIFGKKKQTTPPPSLGDATGRVDERVKALDEKIASLDRELLKYKATLKRSKGSAAASTKRRAMETLKRKKMYESQVRFTLVVVNAAVKPFETDRQL